MGLTLLYVLATLWSEPVELNAGVTSEVRAGESPLLGLPTSQAFVATLVTPAVEADLNEPRATARLAYFPRLVWQSPNALDRTIRPLLLHQASFVTMARPTVTTHLTANAFASYGEPDYSILPQLIGAPGGTVPVPGQAVVPEAQTIVTLSGGALLEDQVTRRLRVAIGGSATHFHLLGTTPALGPPAVGVPSTPFPSKQTTASVTSGVVGRLTPSDDLGLTLNASYATYANDEVEVAIVGPSVFWRTRSASRDEVRVELGAAVAHDLGALSVIPGGQTLSPTARADALLHLIGEDEYGVWTRLYAAVDEYVDPALFKVYPRALVSAQATLVVAPDWSVGVQADFTTSLRKPSMATMNPDETVFSVVVPVRYRFGPHLIAEAGGRWAERAPAVAAADFALRERQLWAYVSLTASTLPRPAWSWR